MARGRRQRSRRDEPTHDTRDRAAREIDRLRDENERLRKQLEEQAKRIADLERQLALKQQNSTITSKPPSSDGLAGQQRTRGRRLKSRRRAGGQPGSSGTPSGPGAGGTCGCDRGSRAGGMRPLRAPLARAAHHRRSSPASSDGVAGDRGTYHRVPLLSARVSRLRHDHLGAAARQARESVRPAADGADCLSDVRVPHAAAGRPTLLGGRAADSDQSGQYPERLGGNQRGGRGAVRPNSKRRCPTSPS
jgi:hypothetical protein